MGKGPCLTGWGGLQEGAQSRSEELASTPPALCSRALPTLLALETSLGLHPPGSPTLPREHRPESREGRLGSLQPAPGLATVGELISLNLKCLHLGNTGGKVITSV